MAPSGTAVSSSWCISTLISDDSYSNPAHPRAVVLNNGNVFVSWIVIGGGNVVGGVYGRILDGSGNPVSSSTFAVTTDASFYYSGGSQVTLLSSGNVLVSWLESGGSLYYHRTMDVNGNAVDASELSLFTVCCYNMAVVRLADGNLAVDAGGNLQVLDASGSTVISGVIGSVSFSSLVASGNSQFFAIDNNVNGQVVSYSGSPQSSATSEMGLAESDR
jgi:hypothetical protein